MSLKFDYLMTILNKLDAGERITNNSIRKDLNVSERSAFRYIGSLNMAGFPVWYDRSKGSYAFVEGYKLKKPILPAEESLALALAKKVLAPLGSSLNAKLESLGTRLSGNIASPDHIVIPKEIIPKSIENYFLQIHKAILDRNVIEIQYHAVSTDITQLRMVEPVHLFFNDGYWYLRAYCRQESALRTFGLDRIRALHILAVHFAHRHPTADDDLRGAFGSMVDGEPTEVIVRFKPPVVQQIQRRQWHNSQQDTMLADGSLEVKFTVNGTEGIKRWIYRWLPWADVVTPQNFRLQIARELSAAAAAHVNELDDFNAISSVLDIQEKTAARKRGDSGIYNRTEELANLQEALLVIRPRTHEEYAFTVWCGTRSYPVRNVINEYVRRRELGHPETLCHRILTQEEWCLPQTYGIPVFREQHHVLWKELTGCLTTAEADMALQENVIRRQMTTVELQRLLKLHYQKQTPADLEEILSAIREFYPSSMPYYWCSSVVSRAGIVRDALL
ncbi:MAG TPA: WYL domain-containing protein [Desulfuromonadales bacterium]|nr:WYL domain-containing protein [Desulfuromonadales bacterium]